MLSRSASNSAAPQTPSPLSPRAPLARARSQPDIFDIVQVSKLAELQQLISSKSFDHSSLLKFDEERGTPLAAAYTAGNWEGAKLLLEHGAARSIFVHGPTAQSILCTLPQSHQPPSSRFGSKPPPAPLATTPADALRVLDQHLMQYLDSIAPSQSAGSKPSVAPELIPSAPQVPQCGVDTALTHSHDSGFRFSNPSPSETDVTFPCGPINLFTNIVVGKAASTSARFSFIPKSGNSAWAVGVIPESQQSDKNVIWQSTIGWNRGGGGVRNASMSSEFGRAESQSLVCTVAIDSTLLELTLEIGGAVVSKQTLQPSLFPLRLGICGHNGSQVCVVAGGASIPSTAVTQPPDSFQIGDFVRVRPLVAPPPITDFSSSSLKKMIQDTQSHGIISNFTSSRCQSSAMANLKKGPDEYWESSGGNPRWIRVHLKPGCRIHDLRVVVQKSDASYCPHLVDIRTAATEADVGSAQPTRIDLDPLMNSSGYSAVDILPKHFDQRHRVVEFNVYDSHGGCECRVRGFIARAFVDTKAEANSCGMIVGTRQDATDGERLTFCPFFGAKKEVHEVSPDALAYMDFSEQGVPSQWTSSTISTSPSAYFKAGDRVVLHEDLRDQEHFDPHFFAPVADEVVTGVVMFALPPRDSEEQRCVLVAREGDCSYQKACFFRGSHLQHASGSCVYRRGDRVKLSRSAPGSGCIAHPDSHGVVVNTGSVRDGIQRNVLVVCFQSGAYSLYPASALVHCSSGLLISSDTERDSLVDELVRLNPSIEQVGMNKQSIMGLISQFGSKFWFYLWPAFSKLPEMTLAKYVKMFLAWSSAQDTSRTARERELLQSYVDDCKAALKSTVPSACIAEIESKFFSLDEFMSSPDDLISQKIESPHWSCKACDFKCNAIGSNVCETCRVVDAGWTCCGCLCAQNFPGTMRCKACKLPNIQAICGATASLLESEDNYAAAFVQASQVQEQQFAPPADDTKSTQEQLVLTLTGFSKIHSVEEVKEHIIKKYALNGSSCSKVKSFSKHFQCKLFFKNQDDLVKAEAALKSIHDPVLSAEAKKLRVFSSLKGASKQAGPRQPGQGLWKWQSDAGDKYYDFAVEHCVILEQAFKSGQNQVDISEKEWSFDLKSMIQTKIGGTTRKIKRVEDKVHVATGGGAAATESKKTKLDDDAPQVLPWQPHVKLAEPAAFTIPQGSDEQTYNDALKTLDTSCLIYDDSPSSVAFWGALSRVAPITNLAELIGNADKAQKTAIQHVKDMNLSKSYRKLSSFADKEAGFDLLHECLEINDCPRFRLLLEVDTDPILARATASGEGGCTIFHAAAKITGPLACLDVLVTMLDPQDRGDVLNTSSHLPAKNTALHHAARLGNVALILKLHEWGAVTNKTNGDGHTPLEAAAKSDQFEAFRALLSLNQSQKVSVNQVLSDILKGMDPKYPDAIKQHNSNCDRIGLEQRKADFEKWRARVIQELNSQHTTLFDVMELSKHNASFGSALLVDFASDEKESISRIKCGTFNGAKSHYDVLSPSVFDRSDVFRLQSDLFQCIAFTLSNVTSLVDVQEKLSAYESCCPNAQKSALYFVACARAAKLRGDRNDAFLEQFLLATFVACCKALHVDASEWLSPAEVATAAQDPMAIYNSSPEKAASGPERDSSLDVSWLEKLSDSKREPFDKLSKLVGLESIKKDAKWMYDMALSQIENQRLGIKSSTIERLNFAFLGNPGTGKTTVASIVAQILHQSGARGPVFDKMTGPEALSMGSKEFCARLAKLTGDTKSQAPPPTFRKGIQIEMCWSHEKKCPDIDTFRTFTPATESATVLSIENGNFVCDRSVPLAKDDTVKFVGTLPEFLKIETSYTVKAAVGHDFDLQNVANVKDLPHPEPFQVQWLKCIRDVRVESNYVFHCKAHHHLEPNFPIRFTSDVGDKISKGSRVYVKRVLNAFSFTVSLALTNRDSADAELRSSVAPAEVGTVYVDNKPQSSWFAGKLKDPGSAPMHWIIRDVDGTEHDGGGMGIHEKHLRFIETKVEAAGGVLFIDEAHELQPLGSGGREGKAILNAIMQAAEEHRDKVSIILGGYKEKIENDLYAADKGLRSRFIPFEFADYSDAELFRILKSKCEEDRLEIKDDVAWVAVRRIVRHRKSPGFANARALETGYLDWRKRAYNSRDRSAREIVVEDVIGKEPSVETNRALAEVFADLNKLVGQQKVKAAFHSILQFAQSNYKAELAGDQVRHMPMNRMFLGNPGTGKSTVAWLYGRLLSCLGLLTSSDEPIKKTPDEIIGGHEGGTEGQVRAMMESAKGHVLIIDEAYQLATSQYGQIALDIIVARTDGSAGENMCVILCGYRPQMENMLRISNPGLSSRFALENALEFEDFSDAELLLKFSMECAASRVVAPISVKKHGVERLAKLRSMPNFGNARACESLVKRAIQAASARGAAAGSTLYLQISDVDSEVGDCDPLTILKRFKTYGDVFYNHVEKLTHRVSTCIKEARNPSIGHLLFLGNPGTGKTTAAKQMGELLHSLGITAKKDMVHCTAKDLIGKYVGATEDLVKAKLQEARGGVLLIDEAYNLSGLYGKDAQDTLVGKLWEPEFKDGKTVVILAGYTKQMQQMLSGNPGLQSRFSTTLMFEDWSDKNMTDLILSNAADTKFVGPTPFVFHEDAVIELQSSLRQLRACRDFGNGRDAETLLKNTIESRDVRVGCDANQQRTSADGRLLLMRCDVIEATKQMLSSREKLSWAELSEMQPAKEAAFQGCQFLKRVLDELQQQTTADLSNTCDQMLADGVTDHGILHHSDPLSYIGMYFTDGSLTAAFIEAFMRLTVRHDERPATIEKKQVRVETKINISGGGGAAPSSDDDDAQLSDSEGGIDDISSHLRKLQGKRATVPNSERASLEKEIKRVSSLLDDLADMDHDARMDAIQAEKRRMQIMERINAIGRCPVGFEWIWRPERNSFQCAGGSHWASASDVGMTEADKRFFEREQQKK